MYNQREVILIEYEDGNNRYIAELIDPFNGLKCVIASNMDDGDQCLKKSQGYVPILALHRTIVGIFSKPTYEVVILAGLDFISSQNKRHQDLLKAIVDYMNGHSQYCCLAKSKLNDFFSTYNAE